jgi:hypothetical protein
MSTVDLENYDPEVIAKAFWLQEKIKQDGLEPVRYMMLAEMYLEREAGNIVGKHIRRRIQ